MRVTLSNRLLTILISLVWLVNGLFCKVLNFVPRHQEIVARILGNEHSQLFTKIIGVSEILMFVWIISGIKSKWCALFQIFIIVLMNCLEFILVPDLLLFGRMNAFFAFLFVLTVYANEFILVKQKPN